MTTPSRNSRALRPWMAGALVAFLILFAGVDPGGPLVGPAPVQAQTPPDSVQAPDSLQLPDSVQVPDSVQAPDSLQSAEDTLPPPRNLAEFPTRVPEGFHTGVWEWDRDELLSTRHLTLDDLLSDIPGVVRARGGHYGSPRSVTLFGAGPGRVRIFWDGMELAPLSSGAVDMSRIGLAGLERIRAERRGGDLRVELYSVRFTDPRPYSLVEVGTGDLDTNLFRGTFIHPRSLGGSVGVALDRIDTEGREQKASSTGGWLRWMLHLGEDAAVATEFRRITADRDTLYDPEELTRTDWVVRGRTRLGERWVAEAFYGSSAESVGAADGAEVPDSVLALVLEDARTQVGARLAFEGDRFWAEAGGRSQGGSGWPDATGSFTGGLRWPGVGGLELGLDHQWWSDVPVELPGPFLPDTFLAMPDTMAPDTMPGDTMSQDTGTPPDSLEDMETEERSESVFRARFWTEPLFGFSLFGELEDGVRGTPFLPARTFAEEPDGVENGDGGGASAARLLRRGLAAAATEGLAPNLHFTDHRWTRYGVRYERSDLVLSAARMRVETDAVAPLGLPMDRDGLFVQGGEREGLEFYARVPLWPTAFFFEGTYQDWEDDGVRLPYFADRIWDARVGIHETFLESGNFELWFDVGVQGRDAMLLPILADTTGRSEDPGSGDGGMDGDGSMDGAAGDVLSPLVEAPFQQTWYAWLQMRIVTVRIFVGWENITNRDTIQDFPGIFLPGTHAIYGVRWTLWN